MAQVAKVTPPVGQFVIQTLLQIAGFAAAIAFGIYAVRSVNVATLANRYSQESIQQALAANQLALLATCLTAGTQAQDQDIADLCSRVVKGAADLLPSAASSLFPNLPSSSTGPPQTSLPPPPPPPTQTPPPPTPSPEAHASSNTGAIAGAVIGSILAIGAVSITCIYIRRRKSRTAANTTTAPSMTPPHGPGRRDAGSFKSTFKEFFMNSTMTSWTPAVETDMTIGDEERGRQKETEGKK